MIFDKIENISHYFENLPLLEKVEQFVADFNRNGLPDGTYEIDGKRVFAMIQSYRTKPQTPDMLFEAHKKYLDLQYIADGVEKICCAPLHQVALVEERYSAGGDIAFYQGEAMSDFTLPRGTFLLLYPDDTHLPGLSAPEDGNVRKIVFKIQVEP